MHETPDDLVRLQALLDESAAASGEHLQRIITDERRLTAEQVAAELTGMRLLVLSTATADGRPISGPVDGFLYRGSFHFGSAPDSVRFRHIDRGSAVSACHLPGEELAVTVHGTATPIDHAAPEHAEFRQMLLDIYVPRFGEAWETFLDSGVRYARIDARRMYTFSMPNPEDARLPD